MRCVVMQSGRIGQRLHNFRQSQGDRCAPTIRLLPAIVLSMGVRSQDDPHRGGQFDGGTRRP